MKTTTALTLATVLAISSAAFAQSNATNPNSADGASNTASPTGPASGRTTDTPAGVNGPAVVAPAPVVVAPAPAAMAPAPVVVAPSATTGVAPVLKEDKNNEKSRTAN